MAATNLPTDEMPAGVSVSRFVRITVNIGFVGGQEKTISYDSKREHSDGVIEYRKYIERHSDKPPKGGSDKGLEDVVTKRNTLQIYSDADISFTEFVNSETMYLATWDDGRNIAILSDAEVSNVLAAVASQQDRMRPEDIPDEIPNLFADDQEAGEPPAEEMENTTSQSVKEAPTQ